MGELNVFAVLIGLGLMIGVGAVGAALLIGILMFAQVFRPRRAAYHPGDEDDPQLGVGAADSMPRGINREGTK